MNLRSPSFFLPFLLLLASLRAAPPGPPPEIPVAEFFGQPAISQMRFSPDGRYLAALQPWERRMNVIVVDLQTMQKTQVTSMKDNDVATVFWANKSRLFFTMDDDGKEAPRLYAVDADGRNPEQMSSMRSFQLLGRIHGDDKRLVVEGIPLKEPRVRDPDVFHYVVKTGKIVLHARNPGGVDTWIVDRAGVARLGVGFERGETTIHYRDSADAEWEKLAVFRDGEPSWAPIAFDGDNRTLFVSSDIGRKTRAVQLFDTKTRQLGAVVHADDTYDVDDVIYNEALNRVVAVTYQAERPVTVWLDEKFAKLQKSLNATFRETMVALREASADNSKLLIQTFSDRHPGTYYLYDQKAGALEKLADLKPNLKPEQLAVMYPMSYQARDGLRIHGYLTLPTGREPKGLPMIIHPHGGPYGPRDVWRYNPEVQFYANRGFAVLQVNFRGSGGYGDWFERAGYKKWGLEMQDDITDAVKWAIVQGIADPRRIVISGASYGGYAAMAGLVYTPELYCAGINYVGVTDIMMLVDPSGLATYNARNGEWWRRTRIGDPREDRERLLATSPINFADRVRVPLLMAYGENDPRVEIAHGSVLARRLKAAGRVEGRDFWFLTEKHQGHGFDKEEKRIAFYEEIDRFLRHAVPGKTGDVKLGPLEVISMPAKPGEN
jgi:dipeptidyl aminopeptidase/acylaminoacyl peptidase